MQSPSEAGLFNSLPQWKMPWSDFVLSYGAQALVIAILVWIPVLHPEVLRGPEKDYHIVQLVPTPVPVNHQPQRRLPQPVLLANVEAPPAALRLPVSRPQPKTVENVPAPQVKIAEKKLDLPPSTPTIPKVVRTNVFSTGSSAAQTTERAAQQVQTGGFGDPHGVPARTSQTQAVNIAQAGGFDMPSGPGYGNGTGGAKGTRGVVASTGFGNGVAAGTSTSPSSGIVRQAGFGDADVAAPPTVRSQPATEVASLVPAEIISKPLPVYTEDARSKRIEGEVLLQVVFEASGRLRVMKVVRGLGYGLDDAAVHAAEQIRFKPAIRDGQPADSIAVIHIIFQLA